MWTKSWVRYKVKPILSIECLICKPQTISAAEYSTWRNSTWQHASKAEAVWRRGCDAIFRKNCNIRSKLKKISRKHSKHVKTTCLFSKGRATSRDSLVFIERKVQVANFTAHSSEEAWHATRPASCAPILWWPSSARRYQTFSHSINFALWDNFNKHVSKAKFRFFGVKRRPYSDDRVIWSLLFVIPQRRHCNSPPPTTCARSWKIRCFQSRCLKPFCAINSIFKRLWVLLPVQKHFGFVAAVLLTSAAACWDASLLRVGVRDSTWLI